MQILIISYFIVGTVKNFLKMYSKFIGDILNTYMPINVRLIFLVTLILNFAFHDFQNSGILLFRKWEHISSDIVSSYDE